MSDDMEDSRYQQALAFLLGRIDYEREQAVPYRASHYKLDRMRALLERLGSSLTGLKIVHLAGTKGKGSTAAVLASISVACGYRVGLFTSPHLDRLEERIVVDGDACSPGEFVELVDTVRPIVEEMDAAVNGAALLDRGREGQSGWTCGPTYFELTTALALLQFSRRKVDLAILEVGMGGRLDSTNVCEPICTAIVSISLDHTRQLGTTAAAIAAEKAGIIKAGVPVVSGVVNEEAARVIAEVARHHKAPLRQVGIDFDVHCDCPGSLSGSQGSFDYLDKRIGGIQRRHLPLSLIGQHQASNAAVALTVVDVLRESGWTYSDADIVRGLAKVHCRARIEVIARHPMVIVDAAHNVASVAALVSVLDEQDAFQHRHLVFATTREKDVRGMLELLLPRFQQVTFTRYLNNPRGVNPEDLLKLVAEVAAQHCTVGASSCQVFPDPQSAWKDAKQRTPSDGMICVTGSFFIASEMRRLVLSDGQAPSCERGAEAASH